MANVSFQRAQAKFQPGLTGFTRGAGSGTFQYDPLGRRTRKIVSGTTRRFHYDGVIPVQELDGAGNILANLLTGLGIDEYFTRSGSPGTRTLLGDALNSTLALADDTGAIQTTYTVAADDEREACDLEDPQGPEIVVRHLALKTLCLCQFRRRALESTSKIQGLDQRLPVHT